MKIGVDLDEVLGEFLHALIQYHNYEYGTNLKKEQFKSYFFWETWGGTREEAIQKVYDFHKTEFFTNIKPVLGAQKGIEFLSKNHELVIITSRQYEIADETKEWVEKYFPEKFKDIFFTNNYSQNGPTKSKKEVCDSENVNLLIEDFFQYAQECASEERKVLLFDKPWNQQNYLQNGMKRVHSWKEVLENI